MNLRLQWEVEKDLLKEFLRRAESFLRQFLAVDDDGFQKIVASVDALPDVVVLDITGDKALGHLSSFVFLEAGMRLFIAMQEEIARFQETGEIPLGDTFKEAFRNALRDAASEGVAGLIRRKFDREDGADEKVVAGQ